MFTLFRRGQRPGGPAVLGALLVALWLALTALPASAHDSLVDSAPGTDEVLTEPPTELVLTFSGEVSELGVQFMVTGPEGRDVVQGTPTVDGSVVTQALAEELVNGEYEVTWRVTSSDGHPISGTIPFALESQDAPATNVPTATDEPTGESTPTEDPVTAEPTPTQDAPEATDPTAPAATGSDGADGTAPDTDEEGTTTDTGDASGGIPGWGWLIAALAAVGLVACGFLAFRRN